MSQEPERTKVTAACHCGALSVTTTVPTETLPLKLWLCSCDTCRFMSGQIAITCIFLPESKTPLEVTGEPVRYATSSGPAGLIRCFCGECGAFVYEDSPDVTRQSLYGGAMRPTEGKKDLEGLVEVAGLTFNGDARDGGLAKCLPGVKAFDQNFTDSGPEYASLLSSHTEEKDGGHESKLHAKCHCGGVEFYVTRPKQESFQKHYNLEGLFYPNLTDDEWIDNPWDIKWWIRGEKKDKFASVLCMCDTCRRRSGLDIQCWAFVPDVNLEAVSGHQLQVSKDLATLKGYQTSEHVTRWFCSDCGATVFYDSKHPTRPGLYDVSVGLLRAPSGSKAEEWLEWGPKVSHGDKAQNKELARLLCQGVESTYGGNADEFSG